MNVPMRSKISGSPKSPASEAASARNSPRIRIVVSFPVFRCIRIGRCLLLLCLDLGAQALLLFAQLRGELGAEVLRLEDLANLDLRFALHRIRAALDPLDALFEGLHLQDPETGDKLLCLGE